MALIILIIFRQEQKENVYREKVIMMDVILVIAIKVDL